MIIKVYEESKEEKKVEKPVYFRLVEGFAGAINLIVVDEEGESVVGGLLLHIRPEGNICLAGCLNREIGLKVNEAGMIEVENSR